MKKIVCLFSSLLIFQMHASCLFSFFKKKGSRKNTVKNTKAAPLEQPFSELICTLNSNANNRLNFKIDAQKDVTTVCPLENQPEENNDQKSTICINSNLELVQTSSEERKNHIRKLLLLAHTQPIRRYSDQST